MDKEMLENLKKQHVDNYQKAVLEIIKNNTRSLVDDDIMSLINVPPLDSMDLIRVKFLDFAKKNKIVLNTAELGKLLEDYRSLFMKCCDKIKKLRYDELSSMVEKTSFEDEKQIIVFYKKDFIKVNKEIKSLVKDQYLMAIDNGVFKNISKIYGDNVDLSIQEKMNQDMNKYLKGNYQKQLLESLEIKILVKDTTLINGVKEQGEHYLFTLTNSRVLNNIEFEEEK